MASCEVVLTAAATEEAGYCASISVYLEAAAFDFDARLRAGPSRADFHAEHPARAFELALAGERPVSTRGGRRELLALVRRMAERRLATGLHCESCVETLNGYRGTKLESSVGGGGTADGAEGRRRI